MRTAHALGIKQGDIMMHRGRKVKVLMLTVPCTIDWVSVAPLEPRGKYDLSYYASASDLEIVND